MTYKEETKMKKTKSFALSLISLTLLSCSQVEASSQSSSESQISSEKEEIPQYVYTEIKKAAQSYTLKAKESETLSKKDGSNMFTNVYQYDITNVRGERPAFKETLSQQTSNGTSATTISYVRGSRGYASNLYLDYKNELVEEEITEDGSKVDFDIDYANPFSLLINEDIVESSENGKYEIAESKRALFLHYLLGTVYSTSSVTLSFTGETLTGMEIKSDNYEIIYQDAYTNQYIVCDLTYTVDIRLSKIGSSSIDLITPVSSNEKEREDILKNAFKNMGNNFTAIVNSHYQDEEPDTYFDTYFYYDGSKIYHQSSLSDESKRFDLYYKPDSERGEGVLYLYDYDEDNNVWIYNEPKYSASYNVDPQSYAYMSPYFSEIAPELFTYQKDKNRYVCDVEEAIGHLGNAFLGGTYRTSYFTNGEGNQAEIYLSSDNSKVEKIVIGYEATDDQGYDISRSYTIKYTNIGTTSIPSFVEE